MTASIGSGKVAGSRGWAAELCAGRAGIDQQVAIVQPGAIAPPCPAGHPGHAVPELMPGCIAACIRAAIAASDTAWPASPKPKARSSAAMRKRPTNEPSMPGQHRTRPEGCQGGGEPGPSGPARPRRAAAFYHRLISALSVLVMCGLGAPAPAAQGPERDLMTEHHVHIAAARVPGGGDAVSISIRVDPGYHIYANPPSNDYVIPTTVRFTGATPERIDYPKGTDFKPAFTDEPFRVYEGTVLITAMFAPGTLDRGRGIELTVSAQACTDRICLMPADMTASIGQ